jgi:hypothetical protein
MPQTVTSVCTCDDNCDEPCKAHYRENQLQDALIEANHKLVTLNKAEQHVLEALRYAALQPCIEHNCGTVCLCGPCHARKALELKGDVGWQR